jgi:hypothetical protein
MKPHNYHAPGMPKTNGLIARIVRNWKHPRTGLALYTGRKADDK